MTMPIRILVLVSAVILGLVLVSAILQLPPPEMRLAEHVGAKLDASGTSHPVTAVLLNFRGYDTLLEIAVLLLAMLGVLATAVGDASPSLRISVSPQSVLQSMTRLLAPLIVLVAGYLLWSGSHAPGGAFQAGAVLAAAGVLLYLAGLMPAWSEPGWLLRIGLTIGFLLFLAVASLLLTQGTLLQYPPQWAATLILVIEAGLTLSLGWILAGLFLWQPDENEESEE